MDQILAQSIILSFDGLNLETDLSPSTSNGLINELPIEVIANIFSFMTLRERRKGSLVCQKWFEAGSFPSFSRYEKLVFHGFYDFETSIRFLSKTKRKYLNLEFRNCDLRKLPNLLSVTEKIHSLNFIDCEFGVTLIELFASCRNLEEFHYQNNNKDWSSSTMTNNSGSFDEIFNSFLREQFVNKNLKIFRLCTLYAGFRDYHIRPIFQMFPNIQELTFKVPTSSYYVNSSSTELSFSSIIREIILLKHQLKKLCIYSFESQLRLLVPHNFTRLKEISLSIPDAVPEPLIFDFFSHHECLERISCSTVNGSSFPTRFFQHLIRRCPHLKYLKLKFRISCCIDLSPEMFLILLSSNLICLKIYNSNIRPTSDQLFTDSNFLTNRTLRVLRIPLIIDHRIQSLFVRCFQNLRFLQLQYFCGTVLESIRHFQQNLRSLKLTLLSRLHTDLSERLIDRAAQWDLSKVRDCLHSLTGLESLDLDVEYNSTLFDSELVTLGELVPLSVKYLRLFVHGWARLSSEKFTHSMYPLTRVRGLEVIYFVSEDSHPNDLDVWFNICSSLRKMRLLYVCRRSRAPELTDSLYPCFKSSGPDFFESCLSLRFILPTSDYGPAIAYYDKKGKRKRMEAILLKRSDLIFTENIADLKVKFCPT